MNKKLRWGILGTGNIARQFSTGVQSSSRGTLAAVGSRHSDTAKKFAEQFMIPAKHAHYESLLADPTVDAIYLSLPNSMHHEWTIKSLQAGKHVLCEKPFANDVAQSEEMFDVAQKQGLKLMEAFMYRSHPQTLAVEKSLASGAIGELRMIRTSFCYRTTKIDGNVRFSPELLGGVLMDVGCYCINFSRHFAKAEPTKVTAYAHKHERGVDDIVTGMMQFPNGILASFVCGMSVQADNTAYLCGSEGYIEIPIPWKPPAESHYTIARGTPPKMDGGKTPTTPPREKIDVRTNTDLYGIEADDFASAVLDGTELRLGRADTIGNMRVIEEMRKQIV